MLVEIDQGSDQAGEDKLAGRSKVSDQRRRMNDRRDKILHHMYDSSVAPELIRNTSATRGNKYKLLIILFITILEKKFLLHVS